MGTLYLPDTLLLAESPTAPAVLAGHRFWHTRLCIGSGFDSWSPASLVISNCAIALPEGFSLDVGGDLTLAGTVPPLTGEAWERSGLILHARATNTLYGARLTAGRDLRIGSDSWIYPHTEGYSAAVVGMRVGRHVVIAAGGGIDANEKGFMPQSGNLNGPGAGRDGDSGGGYGGAGGGAKASPTYGLAALPLQPGSPGGWRLWGSFTQSGRGGGAIHLLAGGNLVIDGLLTANGGTGWYYFGPAGSGGAILLAAQRVSGGGTLRANGGAGEQFRGPGGGGRIAVWHHVPLPVVEQRLATGSLTGIAGAPAYAPMTGLHEAAVTSSVLVNQPRPGTIGFYTIAGTLMILR